MKWSIRVFITVLVLCNVSLLGVTNTKWLRPHKQSPVQQKVLPMSAIYISKTGSDGGTGAIDSPFRTFEKAIHDMIAGDQLYFEGGEEFKFGDLLIPPKSVTIEASLNVVTIGAPYEPDASWLNCVLKTQTRGDGYGYRIIDIDPANYRVTVDRNFLSAGSTYMDGIYYDFTSTYFANATWTGIPYFGVSGVKLGAWCVVGSYGTGKATLAAHGSSNKAFMRVVANRLRLENLVIGSSTNLWQGSAIYNWLPAVIGTKKLLTIENCAFQNIGGVSDFANGRLDYTVIDCGDAEAVIRCQNNIFDGIYDYDLTGSGVSVASAIFADAGYLIASGNVIKNVTLATEYDFYGIYSETDCQVNHTVARDLTVPIGNEVSGVRIVGNANGLITAIDYNTIYNLEGNVTTGIDLVNGVFASGNGNLIVGATGNAIDYGIRHTVTGNEFACRFNHTNCYNVTTPLDFGYVEEATPTEYNPFFDLNLRVRNPLLILSTGETEYSGDRIIIGAQSSRTPLPGVSDVSTGL